MRRRTKHPSSFTLRQQSFSCFLKKKSSSCGLKTCGASSQWQSSCSRLLFNVLDEEHFFKDDVSYSPRCVGVFTVCVCLLGPVELTPVGDVIKVREHVLLVRVERPGLPGRGQDGGLRGKLVVEVADVVGALDGRHERGLHLLRQQPVPIHVLTEREWNIRGSVQFNCDYIIIILRALHVPPLGTLSTISHCCGRFFVH